MKDLNDRKVRQGSEIRRKGYKSFQPNPNNEIPVAKITTHRSLINKPSKNFSINFQIGKRKSKQVKERLFLVSSIHFTERLLRIIYLKHVSSR